MSFIGLLRTLEQITRPPRMGHDVDVEDRPCDTGDCWYDAHGHVCPHHCFDDDRPLADRETETECLVPEDFNEEQASTVEYDDDFDPSADTSMCDCGHQVRYCECPINDEPGLSDDELVGVRGLLQERYGEACTCPSWGNPNWPHRHGCPANPHKSSASAEPAPSPTIVQSAPPPTVDGEGPAGDSGIQQPPPAGRPTSELLTEAANVISSKSDLWGWRSLADELRDRAEVFKGVEDEGGEVLSW